MLRATGRLALRHFRNFRNAVTPLPQSSRWMLSARSFSSASVLATRASNNNGNNQNRNWNFSGSRMLGSFLAAAGLAGAAEVFGIRERLTSDNCGIVGFIGKDDAALEYLVEGLTILQSRGYDSAGITTINNGQTFTTTKFASKGSTSDSIELLKQHAPQRHSGDRIGIAHTRWATHGGKTDANAHPHLDMKERIALVHNGTIENSAELREMLQTKHHIHFKSETDTEVIVQLIGIYLDEGLTLVEAVKRALSQLEGTWGIAVLARDKPDQIIAARNGSPMVVGIGDGRMFVASEISAFGRHTKDYISLKDGEVAVITREGIAELDSTRIEKAPDEKIYLSPEPWPHWTIREIMEQPKAILRSLNYGGRLEDMDKAKLGGLEHNKKMLLNINHMIIAACGTSYHASLYGAQIMRALGAFDTVQPVDAAECTRDVFPRAGGGLLVVSQSGETKDVDRTLRLAETLNIPRLSVVNAVGSHIARTTGCGVYTNAGREHAVASTKAFVTQVTVMALIAAWFSQNRQGLDDATLQKRIEVLDALHRLPTYCGMSLRLRPECKDVAAKLKDKEHLFILGRGYAEPIAREGALKIKEITYLHAEGYPGGALKHGPFALIEKGTPIILIILDDEYAGFMRTAAEEVKARGAHTIIVTDNPKLAHKIADDVIIIPNNGPLTALLAVVPLQLIAYELAVMKGIDPDKPRHLAKAVTVD